MSVFNYENQIKWEVYPKDKTPFPLSKVMFSAINSADTDRLLDMIKIQMPKLLQNRTGRRLALTKQLEDWVNLNRPFARITQTSDREFKDARALGTSILNIVRRSNLPLRVWWDLRFNNYEVYIWRLDREVTDSRGNIIGYNSPFRGTYGNR